MMMRPHWVLFLLFACKSDPVVARAGQQQITASEATARYEQLAPQLKELVAADRRAFLARILENEVLYREAERRGLMQETNGKPRPANTDDRAWGAMLMRDDLSRAVASERAAEDFTDAELTPFFDPRNASPERVAGIVVIFDRLPEAQEFAGKAKSATSEFEFRALINRYKSAETMDIAVTRNSVTYLPAAAIPALFAAKVGEVVGPVSGGSEQKPRTRHYVFKPLLHSRETGTFEQARSGLRMEVHRAWVQKEVVARCLAMALAATTFNEQALAALPFAVKSAPSGSVNSD